MSQKQQHRQCYNVFCFKLNVIRSPFASSPDSYSSRSSISESFTSSCRVSGREGLEKFYFYRCCCIVALDCTVRVQNVLRVAASLLHSRTSLCTHWLLNFFIFYFLTHHLKKFLLLSCISYHTLQPWLHVTYHKNQYKQ